MHLKMSSAKWRPFCPGEDELSVSKSTLFGDPLSRLNSLHRYCSVLSSKYAEMTKQSFLHTKIHRSVKSRESSNQGDWVLTRFYRLEIWLAALRQDCRDVCQILKWSESPNTQSHAFEIMWDFIVRVEIVPRSWCFVRSLLEAGTVAV